MRTPQDALRSLKRYVALTFPDFEVRMSSEKGTFARPSATVLMVPSMQLVSESWVTSRLQATFNVTVYPLQGPSPEASQAAALAVVDALWNAFSGPGVALGHPYRVPLYDYDGVPVSGPGAFADESARHYADYLKVEGPPEVTPVQNPDDELLWSVAANIRMSWLRPSLRPTDAPLVADVPSSGDIH
jgi:hypothetical protein